MPLRTLRRPGEGPEWQARLRQRVLDSVASCRGSITVHTGSWKHDLDQAKCLPSQPRLKVQVSLLKLQVLLARLSRLSLLAGLSQLMPLVCWWRRLAVPHPPADVCP